MNPTTQELRQRIAVRVEFETDLFSDEIERWITSPFESRGRLGFTDDQITEIVENAKNLKIDEMLARQAWRLETAPKPQPTAEQVLHKPVGRPVDRRLPS